MIRCPMCGHTTFAVYDGPDQAMCLNCEAVLFNFSHLEETDKIVNGNESAKCGGIKRKMTKKELIEFGVSIGFLTREKADELIETFPDIVHCKDCKKRNTWECWQYFLGRPGLKDDWFCADGEPKTDG